MTGMEVTARMVELQDSVFIDAAPERVWAWISELPIHYCEWHPDHVVCRYERGECLQVGAVLYTEERLHGKLHRLRLRATEVVRGQTLRYAGPGFEGAFLIEPAQGGSRFTARLAFGTRVPVLGPATDLVLRRAMRSRLAAMRQHMSEEGANLKVLLEH